MKLLTKELLRKLPPLGSTADLSADRIPVICKFFYPAGIGTWYIAEYDPENRIFFGLCCLQEAELGSVSLDELEAFRDRWGLGIERDLYFKAGDLTLRQAMDKEARI
jgi:hypothetical protein